MALQGDPSTWLNDLTLLLAHLAVAEDTTGRTRLEISPRDVGGIRTGVVLESDGTVARIGLGTDIDANAIVNIGGDLKLNHLVGGTGLPLVAVGIGAGAGVSASITGDDISGTITVSTTALATPNANANIAQVTFNTPYATPPVVILQAANAPAFALPVNSWQLLQANVTTNGFALRSGSVALPSLTAATYQWNYIVMQ
jgi:hypothetical protein